MRTLLITLLPLIMIAQDAPIGYWKDYLAYNQTTDVAIADEKIYCVSQGGLFYFNNEDNSINRISKVNGLSENGVEKIKFNTHNNTLIITYENCNIDLFTEGSVTNISDIKRKEINGVKKINNIYCENNLAYLACSFSCITEIPLYQDA